MRSPLLFLTFFILLLSCKEKQLTIEDIGGKYVQSIKKNNIIFEDGVVYDMNLNDSTYVYYLTRHAEKDTIPSDNPRLTAKGYERAAMLYKILKGTRVDAVYSTLYLRTIETVDSLANAKGMSILPYSPQEFKELLINVKENTDFKRILISGHSNTTPVLANFLSESEHYSQAFDDSDYDNFVIIIDRGNEKKELIPLKYKP
jgi:phosphohistidine phosphatase SixA